MKAIHAFPRAARILRSVMIAGAGTAVWMALSATAATADSGNPDSKSILGGITSSVSSTVTSTTAATKNVPAQLGKSLDATTSAVKETKASVANVVVPKSSAPALSVPVPDVPLPAAIKPLVSGSAVTVPVPSVTPVVEQVAETTDNIVGTLPIVSEVVPSGSVSNVVDGSVAPVTGAVDGSLEALVPPINDAVKPIGLEPITDVTKPVVQPIVGVVDAVLPTPGGVLPPVTGPSAGTPSTAAVVVSVASDADSSAEQAPTDVAANGFIEAGPGIVTQFHAWPRAFAAASASAGGGPVAATHDEAPADLPLGPESAPLAGTGVGSGSSQNSPPSPAAAYLGGALIISANVISGLASAGNEQHPKPVSFDPGSSPD